MRDRADTLRMIGGLATVVVGVVHLQQYADFIKDVPTVGRLFILNGLGAGVICLLLTLRRPAAAPLLGALGGIGLSLGALVSLAIARYASSGFFDYKEPTWRTPMVIAVVAEIVAVAALAALAATRRRTAAPAPAASSV